MLPIHKPRTPNIKNHAKKINNNKKKNNGKAKFEKQKRNKQKQLMKFQMEFPISKFSAQQRRQKFDCLQVHRFCSIDQHRSHRD